MKKINMRTEPVSIIGGATSVIAAFLYLLTTFGVDMSGEQIAGIMAVVGAGGPIVAAYFTRRLVWSPDSVGSLLKHPSVLSDKQFDDIAQTEIDGSAS